MKRRRIGFIVLWIILTAALPGCRIGLYEATEPVKSRVIEVCSGDRWTFRLDENLTTGYEWTAACADSCVDVTIGHRGPANGEGLLGAPGQAVVTVRIKNGFAGPSELRLKYRRSWSDEVARDITIVFYRKTGDHAPWK